ncbi:hypothetical protein LBBP_03093 [Leptospira borgpetersenii serovar Ballum]|uniref:Uncharacterized protein n=1 Tax=Leptospira borgpetersenii serovar Ballum TaxID=280505 RepID=A0A0S2IUI1_LEPBO|nr:hypothetical protein LBBP_03093 [Leptospira borgpetersenii serovar Ballum]
MSNKYSCPNADFRKNETETDSIFVKILQFYPGKKEKFFKK